MTSNASRRPKSAIATAIASFLLSFAAAAVAQDRLVSAVDVIRHGDRTPLNDIPTAPHKWSEGMGQLTATGIQQEYQLGAKLRALYVEQYHLLPSNYASGTLYVRSTDMDRTLMSAQAVLMGLYPPGTGPRLPGDGQPAAPHAIQPIPVHSIPTTVDALLLPDYDGDRYGQLVTRLVFPTPEWKKKAAELEPKFARWSKASGIVITNLSALVSVGDTIGIYRRYHVALPPGLADDAQTIVDAGEWALAQAYRPAEIGYVTGSLLLRDIAAILHEGGTGTSTLKYVLFSAHDTTLLSEMSNLGVPMAEPPPYASDLRFALFRTAQGGLRVEVSYSDQPLKVPALGGSSCPLAQFEAFANRRQP